MLCAFTVEQVLAQFCQELVQESERTQERDLASHIGGLFHYLRPVFERKTSLSDLKESHQALKLNPAESRLLN